MFKPIVCMKCNKTIATVKITKIISGEVKEIHLCQECASQISPYQKQMSNLQKDLNEILAGLLKQEKEQPAPPPTPETREEKIDLVCDNCGFPFESYRKSFFLGCSHCYKTFNKYLLNDIRKIHGSVQHTGRVPQRFRKFVDLKRNLDNLKRDLQEAVKGENFERAAEIRDMIRSLNSDESME